jgi:oligoribonuclease
VTANPAFLWTDVETSGLDHDRNYLLEAGFRVTDSDLRTISEASWVVPWGPRVVADQIRPYTDRPVLDMHDASGLWVECSRPGWVMLGSDAVDVFQSWAAFAGILDWLRDAGAAGLPLAGSTVGFDRRWLNHWLPGFADVPHYRSLDVSSFKVALSMWAPHVVASCPDPARRHRVMPDLDDSIRELAHYRDALGLDVLAGASSAGLLS